MAPLPREDSSRLGTTSPEVIAAIKGAELIVERFGRWLDFDDAEVITLVFDRGNLLQVFETQAWANAVHPNLTATFYLFDSSWADDSPDRKDSLVTLSFEGIDDVALDGFGHQNPIIGLRISRKYSERMKRDLFAVDWGGTVIRHEASFTCEQIRVVDLKNPPPKRPAA